MSTVAEHIVDRSGAWMADPGFGIYVHIPFCRHRCHYCDFNTYEGQDSLHDTYVDALVRSIELHVGDTRPATSVFFGGGTPTLLPAKDLGRILDALRDRVGLQPDTEITVEANPETVDEEKFSQLLEAGFNRVSVGVQSLVPKVLAGLGRTHSPEVALEALRAARRAGFLDISGDLIYGSPWETEADWLRSLKGLLEVEPAHISAYALTVEEGTPLATLVSTGRVQDVDPDVQADRHEVAERLLGPAGFERYEVSNWARPGRASRHNVLYWSAGEYLGFGAGAHGHVAGRRYWSTRLPRDFISQVAERGSAEAGFEELDREARGTEALTLGLRLTSGISVPDFDVRFGATVLDSRRPAIEDLMSAGLLDRSGDRLRIAPRAAMISNEVFTRLI
jgi:putative oxygen-independent coproporphyrinogen III oxidase